MLKRLNTTDADFSSQLEAALAARQQEEASVAPVVADIIAAVRSRKDAAVLEYTYQFDQVEYTPESMVVTSAELEAAYAACTPEVIAALELAAKRLTAFHEKQKPNDLDYTDADGVRLGMRWTAMDAAGLYVPGGLASYPSSVLHNAIPAKVAGVERIAMVVPTPKGELNPSVLAAAKIAGITEIYKIGGAQAVAALAYGTKTIPAVDKIVGPGNRYVAEAKRQVFGQVGIDMIAGPSEILVVADNDTDPTWMAADLLSQAEHSVDAQSILVTNDAEYADTVERAVIQTLETLPRREIAEKSIRDFGLIVVAESCEAAADVVNTVAPEHLELAMGDPDAFLPMVKHAGAIFIGRYAPEALGDYVAGPSHVLPTSRTARFSSGLSVYDFIKKSSLIGCPQNAFRSLGEATDALAQNEGLEAHALSARLRLSDD